MVLAWLAVALGCVGIVSALTPELSSRFEIVQGILPPGVPAAARIATLAFGLGLVWLSRSLARRRRRAWTLAVVLVRYRTRFDVPSEPVAWRPAVATGCALGAAVGGALALEARGTADRASDALAAVALVLAFRALHMWLRPLSERVRQSADERRRVRELVRAYGDDSLAFFALRLRRV